jgi:hypothetical protein
LGASLTNLLLHFAVRIQAVKSASGQFGAHSDQGRAMLAWNEHWVTD